MSPSELQPPKSDSADKAYGLVKAAISAIPMVGGPAAELLTLVVQPSLERRRIAWMEAVAQGILDLQSQGLSIDRLIADEVFVTALLRATQAALRTHQTEKLTALRNAVLHIATAESHDEVFEHMCLDCIDDLTTAHLHLLLAVNDFPFEAGWISVEELVRRALPDYATDEVLARALWRDLEARGLVSTGAELAHPGHRLARPGVVDLGRLLVAHIRREEA